MVCEMEHISVDFYHWDKVIPLHGMNFSSTFWQPL